MAHREGGGTARMEAVRRHIYIGYILLVDTVYARFFANYYFFVTLIFFSPIFVPFVTLTCYAKSMENELPYKSSRALEAELRKYKYAAFDKMIDLALDGVVTMPEAIEAFKEETVEDVEKV